MSLSRRHNLAATLVLVAALLAVGMTLICSDGVHLGSSGMDGKCLTMTHSTIIGTATSAEWAPTIASLATLMVLATGITLSRSWRLAPVTAAGRGAAPPPDPLMGRLRI